MPLTVAPIPVPFRSDEAGTIRIGQSGVTLDVVIREFERGADPESIVHPIPPSSPAASIP